jgi:hypothetical protein
MISHDYGECIYNPATDAVLTGDAAGTGLGECCADDCEEEATVLIVRPYPDDDVPLCEAHAREEGAIV